MKRLILSAAILLMAFSAIAQETADTNRIAITEDGNDAITVNDGDLTLTVNGLNFNFKGNTSGVDDLIVLTSDRNSSRRVYYSFAGCGAPSWNHLALIELGSNFLVNTNYSAYTTEDADKLAFGSNKSVYVAINLATLNVALNPSRTLGFTMSVGFACDNYTFAGNYTMERRDGMVYPVALPETTKKSKLAASYLHIPFLFDWNIHRGFFLSVGANIDVLMSSTLVHKKPRTTMEGIASLNPVNIGLTGRIGWNRLYVFANYSFMDMFKKGTGPEGQRMAIGAGIYF